MNWLGARSLGLGMQLCLSAVVWPQQEPFPLWTWGAPFGAWWSSHILLSRDAKVTPRLILSRWCPQPRLFRDIESLLALAWRSGARGSVFLSPRSGWGTIIGLENRWGENLRMRKYNGQVAQVDRSTPWPPLFLRCRKIWPFQSPVRRCPVSS